MLIDSNILVYSLNSKSVKCKQSQEFINSHSGNFVVAQQNIFESLRILTHPRFDNPFSPNKAIRAIHTITQGGRVIWQNMDTEPITYELLKKYQISGSEVFDAVLVATALSNGVKQVATDNVKHLGKYREVHVVNPYE